MITRIELTNFMSHAHTVIEPAPGLTVLVGPNNCGKSAVVTALQMLCHNGASTFVMRHGAKECAVRIDTDDGHSVEWRRKSSASYVIDGQLFDRLGRSGKVPDELHQILRLPLVEASEDTDFDVHFGTQKSPIFLLGSSGANAARFFASSSDAIRLVQIQKRHKDKLAERQKQKTHLEKESQQLNAELQALQPAAELDRRLKAVEAAHHELGLLAERLTAARQTQARLEALHAEQDRQAVLARTFAPLATPPDLLPAAPLARHIGALSAAIQEQSQAAARAAVLGPLPAPPPQADVAVLDHIAGGLAALGAQAAASRKRSRALAALTAPPELADTQLIKRWLADAESAAALAARCQAAVAAAGDPAPPLPAQDGVPLSILLDELAKSAWSVATWESELAKADKQLASAAAEIRDVAETAICPTCGGRFDADRLLAGALAGMEGHEHE